MITKFSINGTKKEWCTRMFRYVKNYWKELKAHALNLPSILLLIYTVPAVICGANLYNIVNDMTVPPEDHLYYPIRERPSFNVQNIVPNVLYLFCPLAGWIADTKIGRGMAIYIGLWFGWIGTLLQSLSSCFQYSSYGIMASVGRYGLSSLALVCLIISVDLLFATVLVYGMDQLMGAPTIKVRAFIYWYVWILTVSRSTVFCIDFLPITNYHTGMLIFSTVAFTLFTLSLCLHFIFHNRFDNMAIRNPYKMVYNVVKYSIHNKYPRNRSALTYWENEVPKRIDFAKHQYGGPYSHEDVENVKTFFRILAVMVALSLCLMSFDPFFIGIINLIKQFKDSDNTYTEVTIWLISNGTVLISVPVVQFIILPLFPKLEFFLINPLKGIGLAMVFSIMSIFSVFVIDLIGRLTHDQSHIDCFLIWSSRDPTINISYWFLLIPSILTGAAYALSLLCIFEFLCSQVPFGMHGMFIGLFWFLNFLFNTIGSTVILIFRYRPINGPSVLSCTTWLTLLFGLITIIGLIVYIKIARWYTFRVRDESLNLRAAVEDHIERQIIQEEEYLHIRDNYDDSSIIVDIEL